LEALEKKLGGELNHALTTQNLAMTSQLTVMGENLAKGSDMLSNKIKQTEDQIASDLATKVAAISETLKGFASLQVVNVAKNALQDALGATKSELFAIRESIESMELNYTTAIEEANSNLSLEADSRSQNDYNLEWQISEIAKEVAVITEGLEAVSAAKGELETALTQNRSEVRAAYHECRSAKESIQGLASSTAEELEYSREKTVYLEDSVNSLTSQIQELTEFVEEKLQVTVAL
jgi:chromosome segregation ATPase